LLVKSAFYLKSKITSASNRILQPQGQETTPTVLVALLDEERQRIIWCLSPNFTISGYQNLPVMSKSLLPQVGEDNLSDQGRIPGSTQ